MIKKTTRTIFALWMALGLSHSLIAQSDHDHHSHGHKDGHHHDHGSKDAIHSAKKAKLVTGQGDFVFRGIKSLLLHFQKMLKSTNQKCMGVLMKTLRQESFTLEFRDMVFVPLVLTLQNGELLELMNA